MKNIIAIFIIITVATATSSAYATVEQNKSVAQTGVRSSANGAYFRVQEGLELVCADNVIWITFDSNGLGAATYSTILAAYMGDKKISYLEYSLHSNGNCYLIQLEITN